MDINLKIATRLFPWSFKDHEDVWMYIQHLKEDGNRVRQLLALTNETEHVVADLVRLIEFENDRFCGSSNDENNTTLLYEVVREALECGNSHVSSQVINRLYVRGFLKQLVSSIVCHFGRIVDSDTQMEYESLCRGRLKDSNATVVICSRAMTVMADKIDLIRLNNRHCWRFRTVKDYNVALSLISLFLKSVVEVTKEADNLIQLFHPRSSTRVPLKMQLMLIDVMQKCGKTRKQKNGDSVAGPDDGKTIHSAAPERGTNGEIDNVQGMECRSNAEGIETIQIKSDATYKLLQKLAPLWAEREDEGQGVKLDYIAIASCIVKLMETLFCVDEILMSPEFERISSLLSEGINDRLGGLNANLNATAMYVAAALSKWEKRREQLMGHEGDNVIEYENSEILEKEPLVNLLAASAPFIVHSMAEGKIGQTSNVDTVVKVDGRMGNEKGTQVVEPLSAEAKVCSDISGDSKSHEYSSKSGYDKNHLNDLVDEIFKDVPVPSFLGVQSVVKKGWTDPPHHIQQCYERLCGIPVVGDVEPAKMFNNAINKPRDMPNSNKKELVAQTMLYLPSIIEKNEPMLSRFAVPIAQLLLKMHDVEQYEDALADLRKKLKLGVPVTEEGMEPGPLQVFSDEHGRVDLETPQHLVYASLLCLAVRCPGEIFESFCQWVTDNEYSTVEHVTMLLCMQCAAKRLSRQKTYRELSQHIATNMHCLKPLTGYTVSNNQRNRMEQNNKSKVIKMPLGISAKSEPISILPRQEVLIRPSEEPLMGKCGGYQGSRETLHSQRKTTKLVEEVEIQPSNSGRTASINREICVEEVKSAAEGHSAAPISRQLIQDLSSNVPHNMSHVNRVEVNSFGPLANMAISRIMQAAEKRLKRDMSRMGVSPSDVVTLGVLETLYVFLQCSGGRMAPSLLEECKQLIGATYRLTHKAEMLDMLGRIIEQIESINSG